MNSALKISVAIAWLTVTLIVEPSHAEAPSSTFSAMITPLLANLVDRLPVQSVNEITPHVEALASIAEGNALYDFFHGVAEECRKYRNKSANKEGSTALEENKEIKPADGGKEGENVSDSNSVEPLKERVDASTKKEEAPENRAEASAKREDSDDRSDDKTNSDGGSSDDDAPSGAGNKAPNAKKRFRLKDLPEGVTKKLRKNNTEVTLTKRGDKVIVTTRKPGEQSQPRADVDITGQDGEQGVKKFVDKLVGA